jgi:hypothetical protein
MRLLEDAMSNARLGSSAAANSAAMQVIRLLKDAQAIVDGWNVPHIGARLQEVIDAIEDAARA